MVAARDGLVATVNWFGLSCEARITSMTDQSEAMARIVAALDRRRPGLKWPFGVASRLRRVSESRLVVSRGITLNHPYAVAADISVDASNRATLAIRLRGSFSPTTLALEALWAALAAFLWLWTAMIVFHHLATGTERVIDFIVLVSLSLAIVGVVLLGWTGRRYARGKALDFLREATGAHE